MVLGFSRTLDFMNIQYLLRDGLFLEIISLFLVARVIQTRRIEKRLAPYISYPLIYQQLMESRWRNKVIMSTIAELENSTPANVREAIEVSKSIKLLKFEYNLSNSNRSWLPLVSLLALTAIILVYRPAVIFSLLVSDIVLARVHQHIIKTF